jgi:ubiquinone/menaquinone biosynthesis C-methylase UbiE
MREKIDKTIESYNKYASEYYDNINILPHLNWLNEFCQYLGFNSEVLDLGCGFGKDSKYFIERGFNVTGIDLSAKLLEIAKKEVPRANFLLMDIRDLRFMENSFSGIWASASLLHIPKIDIQKTLDSLRAVLKKNGVIYISLKEGTGEYFEADMRYGKDALKYWSYYSPNEARSIIKKVGFKIIKEKTFKTKSDYSTHPWIEYLCRK